MRFCDYPRHIQEESQEKCFLLRENIPGLFERFRAGGSLSQAASIALMCDKCRLLADRKGNKFSVCGRVNCPLHSWSPFTSGIRGRNSIDNKVPPMRFPRPRPIPPGPEEMAKRDEIMRKKGGEKHER